MNSLILIPARYASTRFPGKPLQILTSSDGTKKTLIQRSWEAAKAVSGNNRIYITTDDSRIADCAQQFGADVIMTSSDCQNGTERCAEALSMLDDTPDIIINLQGDAPLTPPSFVEALIEKMMITPDCLTATPVLRCNKETLSRFLEDRRNGLVGGTTAVFDIKGDSLYFSKEMIPYTPHADIHPIHVFHHVGVYAYRKQSLLSYKHLKQGPLELIEGLEQLRFLENGIEMACVEVFSQTRDFWELNNPEDISRIEKAL